MTPRSSALLQRLQEVATTGGATAKILQQKTFKMFFLSLNSFIKERENGDGELFV
jgi:hypothetical protein